MACEGYEHGARVQVSNESIGKKAGAKLPPKFTGTKGSTSPSAEFANVRQYRRGVTGVVVEVNHDKHRLTVNFGGKIVKNVSAHDLNATHDLNSNNLGWHLRRGKLVSPLIAKASDVSFEMFKMCVAQQARPSREEALRILGAINSELGSKYALQDVFPMETESEGPTESSSSI